MAKRMEPAPPPAPWTQEQQGLGCSLSPTSPTFSPKQPSQEPTSPCLRLQNLMGLHKGPGISSQPQQLDAQAREGRSMGRPVSCSGLAFLASCLAVPLAKKVVLISAPTPMLLDF